jgi:hypothetical protein
MPPISMRRRTSMGSTVAVEERRSRKIIGKHSVENKEKKERE